MTIEEARRLRREAARYLEECERLETETSPDAAIDLRKHVAALWKQAARLEPSIPEPPEPGESGQAGRNRRYEDGRLYPANAYELRNIASQETLAAWRREGKGPAFKQLHVGEAGVAYRGEDLNAFLEAARTAHSTETDQ